MNKYVIDTQALVRHLMGESEVINPRVDQALRDADAGRSNIIQPTTKPLARENAPKNTL